MTLRKRLTRQIAFIVAGVVLLGASALWGLMGLHQDFGVALRANEQLRDVYEAGVHVAAARAALDSAAAAGGGALAHARAREALRQASATLRTREARGGWLAATADKAAAAHAALAEAIDALSPSPETGSDPAVRAAHLLAGSFHALANLSAATRQEIEASQVAADQRHRTTLIAVLALAAAGAGFAVVMGLRLYRAVMRPLAGVQAAAQRIAAGGLDQRVEARGDAEFAALARDFNRMADELQSLYRDLEQRVADTSRELIRSERLASVGYLAAGVAHEINNPLGIIAGYGERSLQRLEHGDDPVTIDYVRKALGVMCEEAFRCKRITDHLLKLARQGEEARQGVSLAQVAEAVVTSVAALPRFGGRRLALNVEPQADTNVIANEGELRQVVLNLVINALEAVEGEGGQVDLLLRRAGTAVELVVSDNGRGMDEHTRHRAFEPFFTDKRGERPGTGLGLSVAHAIIQDHGGSIEAHSAGPGRGSQFVVRLPGAQAGTDGSAAEEVKHD